MDRMLLSILVLSAVILSLVRMQPAASAPRDTGTLRPPAYFTHDRHMEMADDCKTCHHRYNEKGENVLDEGELDGGDAMRCRTCHTPDNSVDAEEAFHRQCIGCHRTAEASAPLTCGECHPARIPEGADALVIER